jgi:hypothetical protein
MVNGQFGCPARGMGFGLSMQMVLDSVAADLRVGAGIFGWAGTYRCNVNMDSKEHGHHHHDADLDHPCPAARF